MILKTLFSIIFLVYCVGSISGESKMVMRDQGVRNNESYVDRAVENDVDLGAAVAECNKTFVTEKSYLDAMNESGTFPDETDRTPKCFIRCVLQQTGVAAEQEDSYDVTRAALVFKTQRPNRSMEDIQDTASKCVKRDEVCKCERAYQFMKCLVEQDIEKHETTSSET